MNLPENKLIILLWTVIGVLLAGFVIVILLFVGRTTDLQQTNSELTGNVNSLRRQLDIAKSAPQTPAPTATPAPAATPAPTPAPTVSPTPTPNGSKQ